MTGASRFIAYGCLALSMSVVGAYVALTKPLAAVFPVFLLGWLRFGIAAVAMLRWLRRPSTEQPWSRSTHWMVFLESFFGNFLFTVFMVTGVSLTGAVAAGVILSLIPAMVAVLSRVFLGEAITGRVWVAIALGMSGMLLLSLDQSSAAQVVDEVSARDALLGNLCIFAAVLCEAFYAVMGKKLTHVLGPRRISALINLWGFVLMTPLGFYAALSFDFSAVAFDAWLLLVFYAVAASVWTVWLWMTGLKSVPASQAGVFTVMLPVSAALVGVLFLGESFTAMQLVAFALALGGLLTVTLGGVRPRRRTR